MNEFSPVLGHRFKGLWSALRTTIEIVIIPLMIIMLLINTDGGGGTAAPQWRSIFHDWLVLVLAFAVPLVMMAFLEGFYPLGSRSRLTFALMGNVLLAILVWSLFLGERVQNALDTAGYDLNIMPFRFFTLGFLVIWALISVAGFKDNRRTFVQEHGASLGLPMPGPEPSEDPKGHRWFDDFQLSYGTWSQGFRNSDKYYSRFMVLPIILLSIIGAALIKASSSMSETLDSVVGAAVNGTSGSVGQELGSNFLSSIEPLFWIGLAMLPLAFFKGFYPKGSFSRMLSWLGLVVLICLWIYYLKLGGMLVLTIADLVEVMIDFKLIIWLSILAASLWGVYAVLEVHYYRKGWIDNGFRPVEEKKPKRRWFKTKEASTPKD